MKNQSDNIKDKLKRMLIISVLVSMCFPILLNSSFILSDLDTIYEMMVIDSLDESEKEDVSKDKDVIPHRKTDFRFQEFYSFMDPNRIHHNLSDNFFEIISPPPELFFHSLS